MPKALKRCPKCKNRPIWSHSLCLCQLVPTVHLIINIHLVPVPASCPKFDLASSRPDHGSSIVGSSSSGLVEEQQWPCSACTFLNHPALKNCEECDMPRINLGTTSDAAEQAGRPCFCHSRSLFQPPPAAEPAEPKLRRVKSERAAGASFDELSPVREQSPTPANSSNDIVVPLPVADETN